MPKIILPEIELAASASDTDLASLVIQYAQKNIGEKEVEANSSPLIDRMLKEVGLKAGDPWCAAAISYWVKLASIQLGKHPEFVYGGSVYKIWAKNQKLVIAKPVPNCIFCIDHGLSKQGNKIGHTGLVIGVSNDVVATVEGNTNKDGSRNGDGVYARTRNISEITYGFLKIQ